MLEILGIDAEKVELYGKTFLKLIKNSQQIYESMMQQQEDRIQDPNHMNVINISDDDDTGNNDLYDFDDDDVPKERSAYFPSREVEAFNAQCRLSRPGSSRPMADQSSSVANAARTEYPRAVSKPRRETNRRWQL